MTFDYGNNIGNTPSTPGFADAFAFPVSCPRTFVRSFARQRPISVGRSLRRPGRTSFGPMIAAGYVSGDDASLRRWIDWPASESSFQGSAGAHLLARLRGTSPTSAWPSTIWCDSGELSAPIVIGRDHLDSGSVASPNRETESMRDGSDAIADWPILNALVNTAAGASRGSRSTTAEASASATLSMPAWWSWPMAPTRRRNDFNRTDHRPGHGRHAPRRCRLSTKQ